MKHFLTRLSIFFIPITIAFIMLVALIGYMGYLYTFDQIAVMQAQNPILYSVLPLPGGYYKEAVVAAQQPSVMLFGSSRVLSFRSEFCQPQPETFYNAGLRTLDNEAMLYFGERFIDAHTPDILLLSLDQPVFTPGYQRPYDALIREDFSQHGYVVAEARGFVRNMPLLFRNHRARFFERRDPISGNFAIGTDAMFSGVGHRSDGSFQYGQGEIDADVIGSIWPPEILYEPASELSDVALEQVDSLLRYAAERDVVVIGFFPPFTPDVWDSYFVANPDDYRYLPLLISTVESMFADYGFTVYDYTNPYDLAINNEIMMDDWHMSERASLMLYLDLLAQNPTLRDACPETDYLENLLETSDHPFIVIPD